MKHAKIWGKNFPDKNNNTWKGNRFGLSKKYQESQVPHRAGLCKPLLGFGFYSLLVSEGGSGRVYEKARREWCPQSQVKEVILRGRNDHLGQRAETSSKRLTNGFGRMEIVSNLERRAFPGALGLKLPGKQESRDNKTRQFFQRVLL